MAYCTNCHSSNVIKNGKDPNGNQRYLCKSCGKNFTESSKAEIIYCTSCRSSNVIKNGKDPNGNQRYLCKSCGKNFTMSEAQAAHTITTSPEKEPWYRKDGIIVLLTIFFFPLGLALIWANPKYQKKTKILWTAVVAGVVFLAYTGWFGVGLLLTAALWFWVYKKHPALSAADAPSGKFCAYCGAQLPNSGVCLYCGGRTNDGE